MDWMPELQVKDFRPLFEKVMSQAFLQQLLDKVLNWEVVDGYSIDKSIQLLKVVI